MPDKCSSIWVEVSSASEGFCVCYQVTWRDGGVGGEERGSLDEFLWPVYGWVEFSEPWVSEDDPISSEVNDEEFEHSCSSSLEYRDG